MDGVLLLPHQDHRVPQVCSAAFSGTHVLQHEPGNFIPLFTFMQNLDQTKYRNCYVDNYLFLLC